jgi:hypothetical protein
VSDFAPHHESRIEAAHDRLAVVEKRVNDLERQGDRADERFKHIQGSLDSIQVSISRVNWIIITAVIGGIMAFIVEGGLHVGS